MEPGGLYEEYAQMIYKFIYLKCRDKELAEDIVQTTFLKAVSQINHFHGECKVSTWLCQIANHEYLNYCRKHNRQGSYEEYIERYGEAAISNIQDIRDEILERLIIGEQVETIKSFLEALPEIYKQVFCLRVYGEYSYSEIGKMLEKSENWARVTYFRAKERIIKQMKEQEGKYGV